MREKLKIVDDDLTQTKNELRNLEATVSAQTQAASQLLAVRDFEISQLRLAALQSQAQISELRDQLANLAALQTQAQISQLRDQLENVAAHGTQAFSQAELHQALNEEQIEIVEPQNPSLVLAEESAKDSTIVPNDSEVQNEMDKVLLLKNEKAEQEASVPSTDIGKRKKVSRKAIRRLCKVKADFNHEEVGITIKNSTIFLDKERVVTSRRGILNRQVKAFNFASICFDQFDSDDDVQTMILYESQVSGKTDSLFVHLEEMFQGVEGCVGLKAILQDETGFKSLLSMGNLASVPKRKKKGMHSMNEVDFQAIEYSDMSFRLGDIRKTRNRGHLIIQLQFLDSVKTFLDMADDDSTWSKKERLTIVGGTSKVFKLLANSGVFNIIDIYSCIDPSLQELENTAATFEATAKMAHPLIGLK